MARQPLSQTVDASRHEKRWRSSVLSLLTSTIVQGIVIAVLIVTPLMATRTLPAPVSRIDLSPFVPVVHPAPPPSKAQPPPRTRNVRHKPRPIPLTGQLITPVRIADAILDEPTLSGRYETGVEYGVPGGDPSSLMPPELWRPAPVEEEPEPVVIRGEVRPPRKRVHVAPIYPPIALGARVQGDVVLQAVIDKEGNVVELKVQKSVPLLDAAALGAVSQWKYEPTVLNGRPVPVIMSVTVEFRLTPRG